MVINELKQFLGSYVFFAAALTVALLLLCGVVYKAPDNGREYTVFDMTDKENFAYVSSHGGIDRQEVFLSSPNSYLWMFAPIITAIPFCMLISAEKKNSILRFELYRVGKTRLVLGKLLAVMINGGLVVMTGYLLYLAGIYLMIPKTIGTGFGVRYSMVTYSRLCRVTESTFGIAGLYLLKLLAMFVYGMFSVLPAFTLSGCMKNRYLILCIPMIFHYFWIMFVQKSGSSFIACMNPDILHSIYTVGNKRNIFLGMLVVMILFAGFVYRLCLERRCDCGEN